MTIQSCWKRVQSWLISKSYLRNKYGYGSVIFQNDDFKPLQGTVRTLLEVILGFSTLSGTNPQISPLKGRTSTPVTSIGVSPSREIYRNKFKLLRQNEELIDSSCLKGTILSVLTLFPFIFRTEHNNSESRTINRSTGYRVYSNIVTIHRNQVDFWWVLRIIKSSSFLWRSKTGRYTIIMRRSPMMSSVFNISKIHQVRRFLFTSDWFKITSF